MKKILVTLSLLLCLSFSFGQNVRSKLTNYNQNYRTTESFYTPELGFLDSFLANGGIPVAGLGPSHNDSLQLDSIKWYTNYTQYFGDSTKRYTDYSQYYLRDNTAGITGDVLPDQGVNASWLLEALFLTTAGTIHPAYSTVLGAALYDNVNDDWYLDEINLGIISVDNELASIKSAVGTIASNSYRPTPGTITCTALTPVVIPSLAVVIGGFNGTALVTTPASYTGALDIETALIIGGINQAVVNKTLLNSIGTHNITPSFSGFLIILSQ